MNPNNMAPASNRAYGCRREAAGSKACQAWCGDVEQCVRVDIGGWPTDAEFEEMWEIAKEVAKHQPTPARLIFGYLVAQHQSEKAGAPKPGEEEKPEVADCKWNSFPCGKSWCVRRIWHSGKHEYLLRADGQKRRFRSKAGAEVAINAENAAEQDCLEQAYVLLREAEKRTLKPDEMAEFHKAGEQARDALSADRRAHLEPGKMGQ